MSIAAWLGCKDEAQVLPRTLAHLRRIGVDHIYAVDVMSTDGSREIFAAAAQQGDLEMLSIDVNVDDTEVEHRIAAEVMDRARARGLDWLLFCDADEYVLPRTGRLADLITGRGAEADAVSIPRYNVVLAETGPCLPASPTPQTYADILVHCPPPPGKGGWRKVLREAPETPWIQVVPNPKLMIRLDGVAAVQAGHHAVQTDQDGPGPVTVTATEAVIAHLPFSTVERFAQKVRNIIALHEATGAPWPEGQAWHWRMFQESAEGPGIAAEFARNITRAPRRAVLQDQGLVRPVSQILSDMSGT